MHVIGAGVGRTGTYSLKLAVNQLGLGPCHHMEAVLLGISAQVPLWNDVLSGRPDWQAVYSGFASAVDWPTACFFRELSAALPSDIGARPAPAAPELARARRSAAMRATRASCSGKRPAADGAPAGVGVAVEVTGVVPGPVVAASISMAPV